jgi:hypothetical protein
MFDNGSLNGGRARRLGELSNGSFCDTDLLKPMFKFLNFFNKKSDKTEEEKVVPYEQQPHIVAQHERNFEFLKKVLEKYPINTWVKSSEKRFCDGGNLTKERFQHPEVPFVLKCDDFFYQLMVDSYHYPISHDQGRELYLTHILKARERERTIL